MCRFARLLRVLVPAFLASQAVLASAQGFSVDYSLVPTNIRQGLSSVRVGPGFSLGGDAGGAGLSLRAGGNWFGQVGISPPQAAVPSRLAASDVVNLGGGYQFGDGQTLSLQLSRSLAPGQQLGLAVNYDWPRYFVRFSYESQRLSVVPAPHESLRFSAGVRF